jgi:hypothetical protein
VPATILALALALLGGACSSGAAGDDLAAGSGPDPTLDATTSLAPGEAGDDPAGEEPEEATDAPTLPSIGPGATDSGPPTTEGSGLPPVTTVPPDPGGDPDRLYRGIVGTLAPDDILAAGAAAPPSPRPGVLPLTGRAGTVPDRPAAVVKVDNGGAASPHTGLDAADLVVEEEIEGGLTRLAAVFHSTPSIVGPVRSARTTDVAVLGGLGTPLFLYSGANAVTQAIIVSQPFVQPRAEGTSSGYWRDLSRRPPSNLYTDIAPHWASADGDPPPPQFHYRGSGEAAVGASVDEVSVAYPSSVVRWVWEGSAWYRWQRGAEHVLANGRQVSAANVVVIEAAEVDTGLVDASGGRVPEFVFVGSGRATVFTDGRRIEGTWTRPTVTSVATLTHGPGRPIELTPGRTWIQLVEAGSNAVSSS